jgi:hypothetical protein
MRAVGAWRSRIGSCNGWVEGLTRDKIRPSRTLLLPAATIDWVVALTNQRPTPRP